jgi:hypothetical protein
MEIFGSRKLSKHDMRKRLSANCHDADAGHAVDSGLLNYPCRIPTLPATRMATTLAAHFTCRSARFR